MLRLKTQKTKKPINKKLSLLGMTKLMIYLMKIGQIKQFDGIDPETEEGEEAVREYLIKQEYDKTRQ